MENVIWEKAPAKINLTLDVKEKRLDGYHELETVMHKISLADILRMRPNREIIISGNDQSIAWDQTNLVYKAAALILGRFPKHKGVEIFVDKNIPIEAGLAGGSADAAAVLTGIDRLYELNIGRANLLSLATELGSDVAFCLEDGPATALARGRGEVLEALDFSVVLDMVLIAPPYSLSTAAVYRGLDLALIKQKQRPDHLRFFHAMQTGSLTDMALAMENVLETVSLKICPDVKKVKRHLEEAGALKALMSGSGSSVFGIFTDEEKAKQAMRLLSKEYTRIYHITSFK